MLHPVSNLCHDSVSGFPRSSEWPDDLCGLDRIVHLEILLLHELYKLSNVWHMFCKGVIKIQDKTVLFCV